MTHAELALLKKQLRQLPEAECFALIRECIVEGDDALALQLANSCLKSKSYVIQLLNHGLQTADASSIKFWLRLAVSKLGGFLATKVITNYIDSDPDGVAKAMYWLPSLLSCNEPKTMNAYSELRKLADERGIIWR